jgi:hypothetical protein
MKNSKKLIKEWKIFVKESDTQLSEMATAWKKKGLEGPYRLKSGKLGNTLDVIKQYVTPDGSIPTHFMHLGGIRESDIEPVKDKPVSWSNQKKVNPKIGPAKWTSAHDRKSKHGPQFKFGVNPTSTYNTPFGIYAFPLTQETFNQLRDGTLPFAANEPYILIFKPAENLSLIYTSQDIPDDEFAGYVEKLFSDEFLASEISARQAKIKNYQANHPTAALPDTLTRSTKWLQDGNEQLAKTK